MAKWLLFQADFCYGYLAKMERWLSGRRRRTRNAVSGQPDRGFNSHPLRLRHDVALAKSGFANLHRGFGVTKSAGHRRKNMYYVYSLKCKDGYYVGCTDNLKDRVDRHANGHVAATSNRLPITLKFYFAIDGKYQAFKFEKYLKSGSGRAFIKKHFI